MEFSGGEPVSERPFTRLQPRLRTGGSPGEPEIRVRFHLRERLQNPEAFPITYLFSQRRLSSDFKG